MNRPPLVANVAVLGVLMVACGSSPSPPATTPTSAAAVTGPAASSSAASTGAVNPAALPLGDGNVSNSPKAGYVDSCQTSFGSIGGAQVVGPWVNTTAKTWDSTTKVRVQGSVSWPDATFSVRQTGSTRTITTNDLPIDHTTGVFPVASSDPASAYDRNPNTITAQSISWSLPASPTAAGSPSCTSGGPIGVLTDGVLLFNALDGEGRDAGAHETLDSCDEHPQMNGQLHHHSAGSCIIAKATASSTLVGYAIDGYGVYVERGADGALLTDADLDACHGRTSAVSWNGTTQTIYHYDATLEYPYTIGCFHGTPISVGR